MKSAFVWQFLTTRPGKKPLDQQNSTHRPQSETQQPVDSHGEKPKTEEHKGHHDGHGSQRHQNHQDHHARMVADFRRRFWISVGLTVPILILAPLIQDLLGLEEVLDFTGDNYVQFAFATAVFFYGGWPFLKGIFEEVTDLRPGMMTLISLAITVAYVYSSAVVFGLGGKVFFWELATLVDVMLLGHWMEMRSIAGASGALQELAQLIPAEAHRLDEQDNVQDVSVEELQQGDRVLVRPGENVPVDGVVVDGQTTVNEAMLTGESTPVEKRELEEVFGGTLNGEGAITVQVQKTGDESYLSQVVDMVKQAQESRSHSQDLADRAALVLTVVAITVGVVTLAVWLLVGRQLDFALERTVTVMVITCPHALGLAVPLVVAVSTSLSARNGLLVRDRSAFERARSLDAIVFDKTGTLTEGRFGVTDIIALRDIEEDRVLSLAAGLERQSEHPIAAGIVGEADNRGIDYAQPQDFQAIPGSGVEGTVDGNKVKVVSSEYLEDNGIQAQNERLDELAGDGKTIVFVLHDDKPAGAIALADVIREESYEAISLLKQMGVQVMMLTGDSEAVARSVAAELELDDYFARVLPDQKSDRIKEIKQRGLTVAMVGDGVNDAPALVEADIGIAIGAGTDVAIESADIVLVRSDPRDVVAITRLARATYRKMGQNLWWAAGYNIVAIPLAAGVAYQAGILLPPAAGALLMSLSTIIVAVNARLLARDKELTTNLA